MGSENIYVLGAGLMGNGITQVAAMTGHDVTMIDIKQEMIDKAFPDQSGEIRLLRTPNRPGLVSLSRREAPLGPPDSKGE